MSKVPSNCIPTYRQICQSYLTKVSILYSLLSCLEKEGSIFVVSPFLLGFVSPRTPQPAYRPCWCKDRKALFLMPLTCPLTVISSFCAVFRTFTKCEGIGCDSLLTAWRVSLNIFRVFGDMLSLWQEGGKWSALLLQGLNSVQVQVKFKLINTLQFALQRWSLSEENGGAACVPEAHSKAGGYGPSAWAGTVSDQQARPAGAEPRLSHSSILISCQYHQMRPRQGYPPLPIPLFC